MISHAPRLDGLTLKPFTLLMMAGGLPTSASASVAFVRLRNFWAEPAAAFRVTRYRAPSPHILPGGSTSVVQRLPVFGHSASPPAARSICSTAAPGRGTRWALPFFARAGGIVQTAMLRSCSSRIMPETSLRRCPVSTSLWLCRDTKAWPLSLCKSAGVADFVRLTRTSRPDGIFCSNLDRIAAAKERKGHLFGTRPVAGRVPDWIQNDLLRPTKKPRRAPYCGAPTPTPEPSRNRYVLSNRLTTSSRSVTPLSGPSLSIFWETPKFAVK